jgi:hypothetical protein
MINFIKLYVIPFLVLMMFQCGFAYLTLVYLIGKANPLDWHPVLYTLFFQFVLFIGYTSYRALTDNDEFIDIESNHFNYKHEEENKDKD